MERARNYWLRQKSMYQMIDMALYISAMDAVAEEESYPFVPYYRLLRMPIRAFRILSKNMPAPMQDTPPDASAALSLSRAHDTRPRHAPPAHPTGPRLSAHRQHRLHRQWAHADQPPRHPVVPRALLGGRAEAAARRAHAAHRTASWREDGQGGADAVRPDGGRALRLGVGNAVRGQRAGERDRRDGLPVGGGSCGQTRRCPRLRHASMTRPGHAPQACSRRCSPGG